MPIYSTGLSKSFAEGWSLEWGGESPRFTPVSLEYPAGVVTNNPFVFPPSRDFDAVIYDGAYSVLYNRVHFAGLDFFDFGLIAGEAEIEFRFWFAFSGDTTLTSITQVDTEGTALEGIAAPFTFSSDAEATVRLVVSDDGPPFLNATYVFNFDTPTGNVSYSVNVVGSRVSIWSLPADWASPITEVYNFRTEIITADDGTEQRISNRAIPRWTMAVNLTSFHGLEKTLERQLVQQNKVWTVPRYTEAVYMPTGAGFGQSSFTVNTPLRGVSPGDTIIAVRSNGSYQALVVDSISGNDITTTASFVESYPAGTAVYPAIFCKLPENVTRRLLTTRVAQGQIVFDVQNDFSPPFDDIEAPTDTYKGRPVLSIRPDWGPGQDEDFTWLEEVVDLGFYNRNFYNRETHGHRTEKLSFLNLAGDQYQKLFNFFMSREGMLKAFYWPTLRDDLTVVSDLNEVSETIQVEERGLALAYGNDPFYTNIQMTLNNGTVLRYEVEGITEQSGFSTLQLSGPIGQNILRQDVQSVCWLFLARFITDEFNAQRVTGSVSRVSLGLRTLREDQQ